MKLLIALAMLIESPTRAATPRPASADIDLIRAVADAIDENRARFPFGSIEFRYQDARASNFEEAKAGRVTDSHEARCSYSYHEGHAIHEKRHSIASLAARTTWTSADMSSSTLESSRRLTNGKLTLAELITLARDGKSEMYGHGIYPGVDNFYQFVTLPLSLGFPETWRRDDGYLIRQFLNGIPGTGIDSVDPDAVLDGTKVVRISFRSANGTGTMWIDLERGAIPILTHQEVEFTGKVDVYNTQIRHVPGHGWLPFEQTHFFMGRIARRILIDRVEFDKPPGPEVFRMVTSRPVWIGNQAAGASYKPQPFYDLDHLPSVSSGQTFPMKLPPTDAGSIPAMPKEIQPRPRYFTFGAIAVAVLLVIALAVHRIRR